MKIYKPVKTETVEINKIICDCCKRKFDPNINYTEVQEFLSIEKINGYGSVFGDETVLMCDLCQQCVKELIGQYAKIYYKDDLA